MSLGNSAEYLAEMLREDGPRRPCAWHPFREAMRDFSICEECWNRATDATGAVGVTGHRIPLDDVNYIGRGRDASWRNG